MSYGDYSNFDGGFNPSQGAGGFMAGASQQGTSPAQNKQGGKKRDAQALPPFTIKQILDATIDNGKYRIDGREVGQATIVGIVMQAEVKSTDILYTIDDGTGSINVRQYIDEDQQQQGVPNIPDNTYVRIYGNLRLVNDQKTMISFSVQPVEDFNEITFHLLDTIHAHLRATKGNPSQQSITSPQSMNTKLGMHDVHMATTAASSSSSASMSISAQQLPSDPQAAFTRLCTDVLEAVKITQQIDDFNGCTIGDIMPKLAHYTFEQVRTAVDTLSNEGHIYSTSDDDHFKAT